MCKPEPIGPNQRRDSNGSPFLDYNCGDYWVGDRDVCHHCLDERTANGQFYRENEVRYSFGYYAGRYCDECWKKSGYRDATDPNAEFDELYAGESLHGEPD